MAGCECQEARPGANMPAGTMDSTGKMPLGRMIPAAGTPTGSRSGGSMPRGEMRSTHEMPIGAMRSSKARRGERKSSRRPAR
jgi:hypothetical protein